MSQDSPTTVRQGEELPVDRLRDYLGAQQLTVEQFPSGFSNLTYLIRADERELVLRRPPIGAKIKTAHQVRRKIEAMWFLRTQDNSRHTLHHVKRRAEYRFIIAKQQWPRHFLINRVQVREDAILATHVMRSFDLRADGWTTQDQLAIAGAD